MSNFFILFLYFFRFNKTDGFIKIFNGTRYIVLFGSETYDFIYNRTIYLVSVKSSVIS